jgi:hypothetical protein
MSKRDEDRARKKKQRRQKRLQKHSSPPAAHPLDERKPGQGHPEEALGRLIRSLETHNVPAPSSWPGASDPTLSRPDLVKYDLATFAASQAPGQGKLRQLEDGLTKGLLGFLPELDHWAAEEFFWHGLPGDSWHPIDAYLEQKGDSFPPPAREQLRRWKEARIGFYEIGAVDGDTLGLQEWDLLRGTYGGPPFRAITLNINGVNVYHSAREKLLLTHIAPWAPTENLFCGMGYGCTVEKRAAVVGIHYLGLRHLDVVSRPLPWNEGRTARDQYLREWRAREWHSWLGQRMQFPFWAVATTPAGRPALKQVTELTPSTPEQARQFGIYFAVPMERKEMIVAGATTLKPVEVASVNMAVLAEYQAYRDIAGPPPGTVGMGRSFRVK